MSCATQPPPPQAASDRYVTQTRTPPLGGDLRYRVVTERGGGAYAPGRALCEAASERVRLAMYLERRTRPTPDVRRLAGRGQALCDDVLSQYDAALDGAAFLTGLSLDVTLGIATEAGAHRPPFRTYEAPVRVLDIVHGAEQFGEHLAGRTVPLQAFHELAHVEARRVNRRLTTRKERGMDEALANLHMMCANQATTGQPTMNRRFPWFSGHAVEAVGDGAPGAYVFRAIDSPDEDVASEAYDLLARHLTFFFVYHELAAAGGGPDILLGLCRDVGLDADELERAFRRSPALFAGDASSPR